MKIECDIVRDLLPLYTEHITSETSNKAIEGHLGECERCRKIYQEMNAPAPQVQYDRTPGESFEKYVKKKKRGLGIRTAAITTAVILAIVFIRLAVIGALAGFLALDGSRAEIYVDTDAGHYSRYMGEDAKEEYASKWGMDESIFPAEITEDMRVRDYKMVYYDPWDAQYLSYLVVEYDEACYNREEERLRQYASTEYRGYFCTSGFAEGYTLLAMEADPDHGLIYALAGGNNRIVYVELIFCNYFYDIDYKSMISEEYLPVGFDATVDSPYRRQRLKMD